MSLDARIQKKLKGRRMPRHYSSNTTKQLRFVDAAAVERGKKDKVTDGSTAVCSCKIGGGGERRRLSSLSSAISNISTCQETSPVLVVSILFGSMGASFSMRAMTVAVVAQVNADVCCNFCTHTHTQPPIASPFSHTVRDAITIVFRD